MFVHGIRLRALDVRVGMETLGVEGVLGVLEHDRRIGRAGGSKRIRRDVQACRGTGGAAGEDPILEPVLAEGVNHRQITRGDARGCELNGAGMKPGSQRGEEGICDSSPFPVALFSDQDRVENRAGISEVLGVPRGQLDQQDPQRAAGGSGRFDAGRVGRAEKPLGELTDVPPGGIQRQTGIFAIAAEPVLADECVEFGIGDVKIQPCANRHAVMTSQASDSVVRAERTRGHLNA